MVVSAQEADTAMDLEEQPQADGQVDSPETPVFVLAVVTDVQIVIDIGNTEVHARVNAEVAGRVDAHTHDEVPGHRSTVVFVEVLVYSLISVDGNLEVVVQGNFDFGTDEEVDDTRTGALIFIWRGKPSE